MSLPNINTIIFKNILTPDSARATMLYPVAPKEIQHKDTKKNCIRQIELIYDFPNPIEKIYCVPMKLQCKDTYNI